MPFGELYAGLFSLEIIIDVDFLKYEGQNPRLIQTFAILTKLVIYLLLVIRTLRWHHEIWSEPGVDKLLQFLIASMNSTLKKVSYLDRGFKRILSNNCMLIFQFWAELKVWWSAC